MKQRFYYVTAAFFIAGTLIFDGCGSGTEDQQTETKDSTAMDTTVKTEKKDNIFYSMPSPLQLGRMLQKSGAAFDKGLLNPVANTSNYSTASAKAMNLGVYGADLSYAAVFNQSQEIMSYLDASKKLGDELGASSAFSELLMKRLKDNVGKKDSTLSIISEIFLSSNESFKENDQANVYVLALAGGFTEGIYLGTQAAKKIKNNEAIVTRIAEMKGAINNLVMMMGALENTDDMVKAVAADIQDIKNIYDETPAPATTSTSVKSDTAKKVATIGGSMKFSLTKDQLDRVTAKVESLRAKITK